MRAVTPPSEHELAPAYASREALKPTVPAKSLVSHAPAVGLGLLLFAGIAVFVDHVLHGGFYYDDWGVLSVVRFPSHGGALHGLSLLYGRRPGQVLWYAALDGTLGFHAHLQLALAAALMIVEALCLFALLCRLGFERLPAGAIAALVLLFPFSDSLWLWSILTTNTLTTALYLIGIVLALRAFDASGWRAILLHASSLALYLIGIFTYGESFAVLGCLVGLLYVYRARSGWVSVRHAYVRWAMDVIAIAASLAITRLVLPKDIVTPYPRLSLHHMWLQAGDLASGAARVIASAAEPFGTPASLVVFSVVAVLLIARARDRRWLAIAGAGLTVAVAAWAVYVPADYIYSPTSPGTGNRVNGLAAIGIAIFLYGAAMLIARRTWLALAIVIVLGGGYVYRIAGDTRSWNRAAQDEARILTTIEARVPHPPDGASFFIVDWPLSAAPGVPVYGEPYYLSSALKGAFDDRTLSGAQVGGASRLDCGTRRVTASHLPYAAPLVARYGLAYLVDVRAGRVTHLLRKQQCVRASRS